MMSATFEQAAKKAPPVGPPKEGSVSSKGGLPGSGFVGGQMMGALAGQNKSLRDLLNAMRIIGLIQTIGALIWAAILNFIAIAAAIIAALFTTTLLTFLGLIVIAVVVVVAVVIVSIHSPNRASHQNDYFYITKMVANIPEAVCTGASSLPSPLTVEADTTLNYDNDEFEELDSKCFQYTIEITKKDTAQTIIINDASDAFSIRSSTSTTGIILPPETLNTIPGFPSFQSINDSHPTVTYNYAVSLDPTATYMPNTITDSNIQNSFHLDVTIHPTNTTINSFDLNEFISAYILVGEANIGVPGHIDAYGSCPVLNPTMTLGSYSYNPPAPSTGHGGSTYNHHDYPIPIYAMYNVSFDYNGVQKSGCYSTPSEPYNSVCPYYGYAMDVIGTDHAVRLPKICPVDCGTCSDITWSVNQTIFSCEGSDDYTPASCAAANKSSWGYGIVLTGANNCSDTSHTYKIYLAHLEQNSTSSIYQSGDGLGYYCDGSHGCNINPHLHIELTIDGIPIPPEDVMCNGQAE